MTAGVASHIYGLTQGQQQGFGAPVALGALALAAALGAAFVMTERRVAAPMVPVKVPAAGRRAALLVQLLLSAVIGGYVYFIALYMQRALGFSALQAGLGLLPATVTIVVMSTFVTRRLIARLGIRAVLLIGLVSVGLGQLWLSRLGLAGGYAVNVLPGIVATAWGMSLVFPAASIAATPGWGRGSGAWRAGCSRCRSRWAWP